MDLAVSTYVALIVRGIHVQINVDNTNIYRFTGIWNMNSWLSYIVVDVGSKGN